MAHRDKPDCHDRVRAKTADARSSSSVRRTERLRRNLGGPNECCGGGVSEFADRLTSIPAVKSMMQSRVDAVAHKPD